MTPEKQERLNNQLLIAIFKGEFENFQIALSLGAELHCVDGYERTPLHFAVQKSDVRFTKTLVDSGADVDVVEDILEGTPLHYAIRAGNNQVIPILASKRNINHYNQEGETPLHMAVRSKNYEALESLKQLGANLDLYVLLCGRGAPLHVALKEEETRTAVKLLSLGANPNLRDNNGLTPVHLAISSFNNRSVGMVKLLHDKGADLNAFYIANMQCPRFEIQTTFGLALETKSIPLLCTLLELGVHISPSEAREFNNLLRNFYRKNFGFQGMRVFHSTKETPHAGELYAAVSERNLEEVDRLLQRGANINTNFSSNPPIDLAISLGDMELACALIRRGAILDNKNISKFSELSAKSTEDSYIEGQGLYTSTQNSRALQHSSSTVSESVSTTSGFLSDPPKRTKSKSL